MADTRILKERIKAQIADLEEKLRAVEVVERLSLELGVNGASEPPRPTRTPAQPVFALDMEAGGKITVIDLCRRIVLAMPAEPEWTVGAMVPLVHEHGRPDAERTNVATSMKRLADEGFFEIVRRDVKYGNIYRQKAE